MSQRKKTLDTYNEKRDFKKTAEPEGKEKAAKDVALRFVVQKHDASRLHFDFRLEWDGVLLSWAVPKGPSNSTKDRRLAVQVEDHPFDYKDFEGTIPKDEYGGGVVMLWDEGEWEPQGDVEAMLKKGDLKMLLKGERMKGRWVLVRMKPKEGEADNNWLLIKEKDDFVEPKDTLQSFDTSIRSNKTFFEIGPEFYEDTKKTTTPKKATTKKKAAPKKKDQ